MPQTLLDATLLQSRGLQRGGSAARGVRRAEEVGAGALGSAEYRRGTSSATRLEHSTKLSLCCSTVFVFCASTVAAVSGSAARSVRSRKNAAAAAVKTMRGEAAA